MSDFGIDSKPKVRAPSARANRRKATQEQKVDPVIDGFNDADASELNIRVKDRATDDVVASGKRNRMGGFFKEGQIKGLKDGDGLIRGLKDGAADALKRPLTGLFRRPGSRAGRKREDLEGVGTTTSGPSSFLDERSLSPELTASSRMRSDASPSDFDAIAKAPHLTASQLHGMLQIDAFASKYPHLAKLDDLGKSCLAIGVHISISSIQ